MRICQVLGCTLTELAARLLPAEEPFWFALYELEPWGQTRDDVSRAIGFSAVCQSFGAKVTAKDLIPEWDQDTSEETRLRLEAAKREAFRAQVEVRNEQRNKEKNGQQLG